eukprot:834171-Pelagomonas_calceolata.AAC.3
MFTPSVSQCPSHSPPCPASSASGSPQAAAAPQQCDLAGAGPAPAPALFAPPGVGKFANGNHVGGVC